MTFRWEGRIFWFWFLSINFVSILSQLKHTVDASLLLVSRNLCFFSSLIWLSYFLFFLTVHEISTSTLGLSKERGASSKSVLKSTHHPALPQKDIYDQTIFVWNVHIVYYCHTCAQTTISSSQTSTHQSLRS